MLGLGLSEMNSMNSCVVMAIPFPLHLESIILYFSLIMGKKAGHSHQEESAVHRTILIEKIFPQKG